jgi:hypothetical protein
MTDLDRLIDAAANEIVAHEPSPNLRYAVTARIAQREPRRRRIWLFAVPSAAVAVVVVLLLYARAVTPINEGMAFLQARRFAQELAQAPSLSVRAPLLSDAPATARDTTTRRLPADPVAQVQPLRVEPIGVETIDVQPLTASIATIDLANLTVEPLTASNN